MKLGTQVVGAALAWLAFCVGNSCDVQAASVADTSREDPALETGLDNNGHLQAVSLPDGNAFAYARLRSGVQIRVGGVTKNVIFYGPGTVRELPARLAAMGASKPLVVTDKGLIGTAAFRTIEALSGGRWPVFSCGIATACSYDAT